MPHLTFKSSSELSPPIPHIAVAVPSWAKLLRILRSQPFRHILLALCLPSTVDLWFPAHSIQTETASLVRVHPSPWWTLRSSTAQPPYVPFNTIPFLVSYTAYLLDFLSE